MRPYVTIVDDFFDDFAAMRGEALRAEYKDAAHKHGKYPGRNSQHSYATDEAIRKLAFITGGPIRWDPNIGSGHFRSTLASDVRDELSVHFDATTFSAVIYLNSPEQCAGRLGTKFWRHVRTGVNAAPADPAQRTETMRTVVSPDTLDESKWELELAVPMVSNRMVLYRAPLFHSPADEFGTDVATGRLIQVFFFNRAR